MNLAFRTALLSGTRIVASPFTPLSLFASGEAGAWYDPSDMSTMFQDAAGTTAVTAVEQPVSLLLDKSQSLALGSELVTNGDFSNGTTGWSVLSDGGYTPTLSVVSGALQTIYTGNGARAGAYQAITTVVGKWYTVTGTAAHIAGTNRNASIRIGTGTGNEYTNYTVITTSSAITSSTLTSFVVTFLATSTSTTILLVSGGTGTSGTYTDQFDNISVKEIAGSHAYTPSTATASRPVLSARVNLLTKTEQFDDAVWVKATGCSISATNSTTAPDGTVTADTYSQSASATDATAIYREVTTFTNFTYTFSLYVKKIVGSWVVMFVQQSANGNGIVAYYNLDTGLVGTTGTYGSGTTFVSASMTAEANGFYRISITGIFGSASAVRPNFAIVTADNSSTRLTNSSAYIWGADLRVANDGVAIPAYQRVNTSTDYDTTQFPYYLRFDGSDDYMLTGTITPGTDKAQVFAGVRKLSALAMIPVETSATITSNNGAIGFFMDDPDYMYTYSSKGTTQKNAITTLASFAAPNTSVLTGTSDIGGDVVRLRINGSQRAQDTTDQGTGNYLAYPMYIGRRGGSSLPFNGYLYGLIVRFGANLTDTQVTNTETWMNGKTKAY